MMKADQAKPEIIGMISGPNIFCHYRIYQNKLGNIQINIISQTGTAKEIKRLGSRFLTEVLNRVSQEKNSNATPLVKYTKGQFYLKRRIPGMHATHTNCQAALGANKLDQTFLQHLGRWGFQLLYP